MLLSTFFRIINQQHPEFYAIFFFKINPDAHVSTKMNTITYYKGGGGSGGNSPRKPKKCKNEAFPFHVMMWIQIRARGVRG